MLVVGIQEEAWGRGFAVKLDRGGWLGWFGEEGHRELGRLGGCVGWEDSGVRAESGREERTSGEHQERVRWRGHVELGQVIRGCVDVWTG